MITNKDIRVENGSLILNGDPYPLDGQSPEAIMVIVKDNSDTTPTENSDAPITSGGVYTALAGKQNALTFDNAPTDGSTNPVTSGGIKDYIDTSLMLEAVSVTDGENSSVVGFRFNGLLIFTGNLLNTTTTASTWITTNMTHSLTLTTQLQVAMWSAATGDWAGFANFDIDGSVKVYGKYNGNFTPKLLGAVKM